MKANPNKPDAHLESFVSQIRVVTEAWGNKHDLLHDSGHKDPLKRYDSEPGEGEPLLTFWSEGDARRVLYEGYQEADELLEELEKLGVFLEWDDSVTANYYLINQETELQRQFDALAQWRWTCRLIEADTADVSGDIYSYFAKNPEDFHRLPHRAFEELISSIFAARGWKTRVGPGSGDKGVDVRIWQESPLGDNLTLIQAKRYAKHQPIRLEAVAALEAHSKREQANGLFITTSRYLPGVREWAGRESVLQLADMSDLREWCREASHLAVKERAHALALESFLPLLHRIREGEAYDRLVTCSRSASFCVVLKETATGALLVHVPSVLVAGDLHQGAKMPVLDGQVVEEMPGGAVFRAIRTVTDSRVHYWGKRRYYTPWDGQPLWYDTWD